MPRAPLTPACGGSAGAWSGHCPGPWEEGLPFPGAPLPQKVPENEILKERQFRGSGSVRGRDWD